MGLGCHQQAGFLKVFQDALPCLVAIKPPVGCGGLLVHAGRGGEDVDHGQVMALAHGVVIKVVCGRDLHAARSKGRVHVVVGNNGNVTMA